jgi:hypothetical protein
MKANHPVLAEIVAPPLPQQNPELARVAVLLDDPNPIITIIGMIPRMCGKKNPLLAVPAVPVPMMPLRKLLLVLQDNAAPVPKKILLPDSMRMRPLRLMWIINRLMSLMPIQIAGKSRLPITNRPDAIAQMLKRPPVLIIKLDQGETKSLVAANTFSGNSLGTN